MRKTVLAATFAITCAAAPAAAGDKFWQTYADIGAIGIPVAAGIITLSQDDSNGMKQLAFTGGSALLATEVLKYTVNSTRPNGGDHSFPSGHTSMAFSGAGYLRVRYGWKVGLPFELLAASVGFARVQSHDHHWYDVVAGAAIGEGAAQIFTRRLDENMRVSVAGDTQGGMVSFAAKF